MTLRNTRHPFSNALYSLQPDGNIEVVDGDRRGLFNGQGQWIEGPLRECDPQLCVWVANNPELEQPLASDSHLTTTKGSQA